MNPTETSGVIVIPTLNEALTIGHLLERIINVVPSLDVLVVDDTSPDGTADVVTAFAERYPQVHLLLRKPQGGFTGAYRDGFRWALDHHYDFIIQMDADGSHRPEYLPEMTVLLSEADLVVGSRWIPGGAVVNWPLSRLLLSRAGNLYIRSVLRLGVRDATGGFRAWSRPALEAVDPLSLTTTGYTFQIETLRRARRQHVRVKEMPIIFPERTAGVSKMSGDIIQEALMTVTRWGAQDLRHYLRTLMK